MDDTFDNLANISFTIEKTLVHHLGIGMSYSRALDTMFSEGEWSYRQGIKLIASDFQFLHWNKIITDLGEIRDEIFDEDSQPPTQAAEENIKSLLHSAFEKLGLRLQIPNFVPTDSGGIEAEWKKDGRYLQLICPPTEEKKPYLFIKENDKYGIEEFQTSEEFIERINWLIEN